MKPAEIQAWVYAHIEACAPVMFADILYPLEKRLPEGVNKMRAVDRAIQSLRKQGRITFDPKRGWSVAVKERK